MKKWMTLAALLLVVAGCTKHTVRERDKTDVPDGKTVEVSLHKRADWTLQYVGREDYIEDNNRKIRVEHVKVTCPGADYYILRTIAAADFRNADLYNNDRKAFFEQEAEYLRQDAATYGEKVTDYFYIEEMHDYLLDRMRMGDWILFLIGMDKEGYITGDYAETSFTLAEETPTEEYLRWIGEWEIKGGSVTYPVRIEQSEANCAYFLHGWETGESINAQTGTVMDQEYLETYFDVDNLNMYFTGRGNRPRRSRPPGRQTRPGHRHRLRNHGRHRRRGHPDHLRLHAVHRRLHERQQRRIQDLQRQRAGLPAHHDPQARDPLRRPPGLPAPPGHPRLHPPRPAPPPRRIRHPRQQRHPHPPRRPRRPQGPVTARHTAGMLRAGILQGRQPPGMLRACCGPVYCKAGNRPACCGHAAGRYTAGPATARHAVGMLRAC